MSARRHNALIHGQSLRRGDAAHPAQRHNTLAHPSREGAQQFYRPFCFIVSTHTLPLAQSGCEQLPAPTYGLVDEPREGAQGVALGGLWGPATSRKVDRWACIRTYEEAYELRMQSHRSHWGRWMWRAVPHRRWRRGGRAHRLFTRETPLPAASALLARHLASPVVGQLLEQGALRQAGGRGHGHVGLVHGDDR